MIACAFTTTRTGLVVDGALLARRSARHPRHALGVARLIAELLGALPRPRHAAHEPRPPLALRCASPQGGDGGGAGASRTPAWSRPTRSTPSAGWTRLEWAAEVLPSHDVWDRRRDLRWCPPRCRRSRRSSRRSRPGCAAWRGLPKALVDASSRSTGCSSASRSTRRHEKLVFDAFWLSLSSSSFGSRTRTRSRRSSRRRATCGRSTSAGCGTRTRRWGTRGKLPNVAVLFMRWAPLVLMYMIDMQLWFMLWTAFYGTSPAGSCTSARCPPSRSFRARFLAAASDFNRKVLSPPRRLRVEREAAAARFAASSLDATRGGRARRRSPARDCSEAALGPVTDEIGNESLRFFAEAWNAIVLRHAPVRPALERRELRLLFPLWRAAGANFSRCTYLPSSAPRASSTRPSTTPAISPPGGLAVAAQASRARAPAPQGPRPAARDARGRRRVLRAGRWLATTLLGPRHADALAPLLASTLVANVERGEVLDTRAPPSGLAPTRRRDDATSPRRAQDGRASGSASPRASAGRAAPPRRRRRRAAASARSRRRRRARGAAGRWRRTFNVSKVKEKLAGLDAFGGCVAAPKVAELEAIKFTPSALLLGRRVRARVLARLRARGAGVEKLRRPRLALRRRRRST